ncbi:NUDIX domain-containing protein [Verrucomicrobiota bacterium]
MARKGIEILSRGVHVAGGHVLLCHTKGAGNTYLPGGHVEFMEKASDGLVREIAEELGLDAHAGAFLGAVEHTFVQKGKRHCEVNIVFRMDIEGIRPPAAPPSREGYIEFLWAPLDALGAAKLEPVVLCEALPRWLEGESTSERWLSAYV